MRWGAGFGARLSPDAMERSSSRSTASSQAALILGSQKAGTPFVLPVGKALDCLSRGGGEERGGNRGEAIGMVIE